MSNILAICGPTCTDKTAVALALSRLSGYKVKNAGEYAKSIVKLRKLPSAAAVPEEALREMDEDTLALARTSPMPVIVESGFADCVLGGEPNVFVVRLAARDEVREKRFEQRKVEGGGRTRQLGESVADQDRSDAELRARLYADAPRTPDLEVDTSDLSREDVARRIWDAFVTRMGDTDIAGPQYSSSPYRYGAKRAAAAPGA